MNFIRNDHNNVENEIKFIEGMVWIKVDWKDQFCVQYFVFFKK